MQLWPEGGTPGVESLIQRLNRQSVLVQLRWLDVQRPETDQALAELSTWARQELGVEEKFRSNMLPLLRTTSIL